MMLSELFKDWMTFVQCNQEFSEMKDTNMDHSAETSYSSTVPVFLHKHIKVHVESL